MRRMWYYLIIEGSSSDVIFRFINGNNFNFVLYVILLFENENNLRKYLYFASIMFVATHVCYTAISNLQLE